MLAAIDAGSNTLRLLIGNASDGRVFPELYLRRICRLAGGFSQEEGLSPEAMERTLLAFQEFAEVCKLHHVEQVRAVGTAAFRQAVNGDAFSRAVTAKTLLPLEIISGEKEAETMTAGVLSALDPVPENSLIIDIGGGSTEFVLCAGRTVVWSFSLALGVVHLTETYKDPEDRQLAIANSVSTLHDKLVRVCKHNQIEPESLSLVGTAGTVTTLAALDLKMSSYDWRMINNYTMTLAKLAHWQELLLPLSVAEREALPGMEEGRGDLIIAGIEIVLALMQKLNSGALTVSDFGILEGLLLSLKSS